MIYYEYEKEHEQRQQQHHHDESKTQQNNNSNPWNIHEIEQYLTESNSDATTTTTTKTVKVNRNMVFEEYWMEYVERIVATSTNNTTVGPLRWWDRHTNQHTTLANLVPPIKTSSA